MNTTRKELHSSQARYKRYFDKRVRLPRQKVMEAARGFVRKYNHPTDEPKHNLAPIATGPNKVTEADDMTCVILMEYRTMEIITLDRVVLAPEREQTASTELITGTNTGHLSFLKVAGHKF